jgi:hypothetical protein
MLRKAIHENIKDNTLLKVDDVDEEKSVTIWIKQGEEILKKPIRLSAEKLSAQLKLNDNLKNFEELAVKIDRIGFMLYCLNVPQELQQSYLKWLCVMFCEVWNKLAPYILLRRKERFKEYQRNEQNPPSPLLFVPYFEKLAYESYEYYHKELGDKAKILCLSKKCSVEI